MPRRNSRWSGWRGIGLIAITFVYFLIFAQFAFLKRLADLGITDTHLKAVMGAMAAGGILLSLLTPRIKIFPSRRGRLRTALTTCAAAAFLILLPLNLTSAIGVSFLIGSGLGLLTVTLVTHLRMWLDQSDPLLSVGLGTGLGYFICNIPVLFNAPAAAQALTASGLCLAGLLSTFGQTSETSWTALPPAPAPATGFLRVLSCFTALVWLDSAAFFIIQNTPELKAGTWEGTLHLWANGTLHFSAALVSVWILRRGGLSRVFALAFLALAFACLLLLHPSGALLASALYPVGVSLYSVALVAYPSLLAPSAPREERGRRAGWIYAVAGWFGSAMGIGMGQNLGHVPPAFVLIAGIVILAPVLLDFARRRKREFTALVAVLLTALCIEGAIGAIYPSPPLKSPVERGRRVYISEGCINCHSQYVRPNSPDVLLWGPVRPLEELLYERPPLIGDRRQGPDLAQVGTRRSPLWLKAHFYNPAELSHASFMPSYADLFRDRRGDDLVAYLSNLQGGNIRQHLMAEAAWRPSHAAVAVADAGEGRRLFSLYCGTCHAAGGHTRQSWQLSFRRLPPDLAAGPYRHLPSTDSPAQRTERLARIEKFGLPGTDMPGHEYLSDRQLASISLWLTQIFPGEKQ